MFKIEFQLILYFSIFTLFCLLNTGVYGKCKYGFTNANGKCLECGKTKFKPNIKIVGGVIARKGSWPAQAFVRQYEYDSADGMMYGDCGGTLIGPTTVLTAAHCISKSRPNAVFPTLASSFVIVLGAHNISFLNNDGKPPREVIIAGAKKVIIHESFETRNGFNDIAIIKLNRTIPQTDYINYACLPKKSTKFPKTKSPVFAAGWGTLDENDYNMPDLLQNVKLTVYTPFYCRNVATSTLKNWESQICAGLYSGGKDTCQGDSGGGIISKEKINGIQKHVVSGITSYGTGCGRYQKPGYGA